MPDGNARTMQVANYRYITPRGADPPGKKIEKRSSKPTSTIMQIGAEEVRMTSGWAATTHRDACTVTLRLAAR